MRPMRSAPRLHALPPASASRPGKISTCSADAAPGHERPVATDAVGHGGEDHHVSMIARHRAAGTEPASPLLPPPLGFRARAASHG